MEILDFQKQLDRIETAALSQKNVLTFDEASRFIGVSHSDLYKRTSNREIPHYKPRGKMLYFDRLELESYLKQNPIITADELEAQAQTYVATGRKGVKHV
ncbi:MAG: helix-turn-helix domain-containing protein [Paludibacteraceae bacterium]|nr:helix-turn-helix domain-containing protein [Paludibacteraceae bacterium]